MEHFDLSEQHAARPKADRVILVSPASPGSKGDEGMHLGALRIVDSVPVQLLNPQPGPLWTDVLKRSRDLSHVTEQQGAFADFLPHIRPTDAVLVVGADVMDGTVGPEGSLERLSFLKKAISRGARGAIVCSFRSDVHPLIVRAMKSLSGADIFLRDLRSLESYFAQVGTDAEFFPDLSYFAAPSDLQNRSCDSDMAAWLAQARERGGKIIGLNFSEHMFRSFSDRHNTAARVELVKNVIDEILKAIPEACFVLVSNDNREWDNHPSDDTYQKFSAEILKERIGEDRFKIHDSSSSYFDNIVLMKFLDLLITGRMHLAHAAVRRGTVPLIMMGCECGYTSMDKMRGMYETVLGTEAGVVSEVGALSATISWAQEKMPYLKERLEEWIETTRFEEEALKPMLVRSLGLSGEPASGKEMSAVSARRRDVEARLALKPREAADAKASYSPTDIQYLHEDLGVLRSTAEKVTIEADRLVDTLLRSYRRPWEPLQWAFQREFLKLILIFRPLLSKRAADRLQRSIQKRDPAVYLSRWTEFKEDIGDLAGLSTDTSSDSKCEKV
ncbi:MAG: hypothetical protein BGN84_17975 [Afipia sp. 62-7]|nr:hypothetical protein [Afipia sp.]OJU18483.1 MAG: hypothetical protein BGN84_17975 [Afipia sp. 62-7]